MAAHRPCRPRAGHRRRPAGGRDRRARERVGAGGRAAALGRRGHRLVRRPGELAVVFTEAPIRRWWRSTCVLRPSTDPTAVLAGSRRPPISPRPWRPPSRTRPGGPRGQPGGRPPWRRSPRAPAAHGPGGRDAGVAVRRAGCVFVPQGPGRRSGTTSPAPTTSCRRAAPPCRLGAVRADLLPGGHAGAGCALREARAAEHDRVCRGVRRARRVDGGPHRGQSPRCSNAGPRSSVAPRRRTSS